MTRPIVRNPIYRRRRFDAEIIELCVRWYVTYRLSYRDLVAIMAERGITVSHTTIHRWVIQSGGLGESAASRRKTARIQKLTISLWSILPKLPYPTGRQMR